MRSLAEKKEAHRVACAAYYQRNRLYLNQKSRLRMARQRKKEKLAASTSTARTTSRGETKASKASKRTKTRSLATKARDQCNTVVSRVQDAMPSTPVAPHILQSSTDAVSPSESESLPDSDDWSIPSSASSPRIMHYPSSEPSTRRYTGPAHQAGPAHQVDAETQADADRAFDELFEDDDTPSSSMTEDRGSSSSTYWQQVLQHHQQDKRSHDDALHLRWQRRWEEKIRGNRAFGHR